MTNRFMTSHSATAEAFMLIAKVATQNAKRSRRTPKIIKKNVLY